MPGRRRRQTTLALLRLAAGHAVPDLASVQRHFAAAGLAKQKWPEEIVAQDDFPRTPSGKIKKFVLRDQIRARAAANGA